MRKILIATAAALIAVSTPTRAQTDEDMNKQIDASMGDHKPYAAFFLKLQHAVSAGDKQALAAMVDYPFVAHAQGKAIKINDAKHFVADYDKLVTTKVKAAVAKQTYATLFTNWQGVMVGDGEIWFSGVGDSNTVKIIAINN